MQRQCLERLKAHERHPDGLPPSVRTVGRARIHLWNGNPAPMILTESRSLGGVLRDKLSRDYLTPIAATNGQVGGLLIRSGAKAGLKGGA